MTVLLYFLSILDAYLLHVWLISLYTNSAQPITICVQLNKQVNNLAGKPPMLCRIQGVIQQFLFPYLFGFIHHGCSRCIFSVVLWTLHVKCLSWWDVWLNHPVIAGSRHKDSYLMYDYCVEMTRNAPVSLRNGIGTRSGVMAWIFYFSVNFLEILTAFFYLISLAV